MPFVIAATAVATLAFVPGGARRAGRVGAIAWMGAAVLGAVSSRARSGGRPRSRRCSAARSWTAAGSSACRTRSSACSSAGRSTSPALPRTCPGAALIAAAGLFAGLPLAGANIGAAVTLFAAAGLWWGLRGERAWCATRHRAAVAGRRRPRGASRIGSCGPATHITTFSEGRGTACSATRSSDRLRRRRAT